MNFENDDINPSEFSEFEKELTDDFDDSDKDLLEIIKESMHCLKDEDVYEANPEDLDGLNRAEFEDEDAEEFDDI